MNSDDPKSGEVDIETYDALRSAGYSFCEKPVDIQCKNIGANTLVTGTETIGATCSVSNGLTCNFFCDDYEVRVACCYCSPKPIGKLHTHFHSNKYMIILYLDCVW